MEEGGKALLCVSAWGARLSPQSSSGAEGSVFGRDRGLAHLKWSEEQREVGCRRRAAAWSSSAFQLRGAWRSVSRSSGRAVSADRPLLRPSVCVCGGEMETANSVTSVGLGCLASKSCPVTR